MTWYSRSRGLAVGLVSASAVAWSCHKLIANKEELRNEHVCGEEKSTLAESLEKRLPKLHLPIGTVLASWTTNQTPSPGAEWNFNWDRRDPKISVEPLKNPATCSEKERQDHENKIKQATPKATRHLFLIRHGQYVYGKDDKERLLTELGRQQAGYTGTRLQELGHSYSRLVNSSMTRAQETASIIAESLPHDIPREQCDLLREGAPIPPEPPVGNWKPEANEFFEEGARIEAAFRNYVHRAPPKQEKDSYEIIVCHGNVIRYFVCRALQFPPDAWLRFGIYHASVTHLIVSPRGHVALRFYGDAGFMPANKLTQS